MRYIWYVIGLLGLWLAAAALVFSLATPALASNIIAGLLIAILSGLASGRRVRNSFAYVAGLLGLWLAASALVFAIPTAAMVSNVMAGLLIALMAGLVSVSEE